MSPANRSRPSLGRHGVTRAASTPFANAMIVVAAVVVLLATMATSPAAAHSSLTMPTSISFTRDCRVSRGGGGTARNCPGPCPNVMLRRHGLGSSSAAPAATYARGQRVRVRWARNNHEGGFVRWSIVPVGSMMDAVVHEQMAFQWGCWSAGRFACRPGAHRNKYCIDDALGKPVGHAYEDHIRIPRVYPDGDYVLSFVRPPREQTIEWGESNRISRLRWQRGTETVAWITATTAREAPGTPATSSGRRNFGALLTAIAFLMNECVLPPPSFSCSLTYPLAAFLLFHPMLSL